jgi:hypothetical protein
MSMRRRDFIAGLAGAAAWPLAARAQQGDRVRRIGVLMTLAADDPETLRRTAAFVQGLQELGWTDGRNVRIDTRWAGVNVDDIRKQAAELVALAPLSVARLLKGETHDANIINHRYDLSLSGNPILIGGVHAGVEARHIIDPGFLRHMGPSLRQLRFRAAAIGSRPGDEQVAR